MVKKVTNLWGEFKKFAVKGNMIDLAVGIIIGAAFNKIVDALVKQIISPPLGFLTAGVEFGDLKWVIKEPVLNAAGEVAEPGIVIGYGLFLEAMIDFGIIALTLFFILRFINNLKDKAEDDKNTTVPTPKDIQLLAEIRDEMKRMNGNPPAPQTTPDAQPPVQK